MDLSCGRRARRKAVSGIIAAILLFAMLFTVGASYFVFVNDANTEYSQTYLAAASAAQQASRESMQLASELNGQNHIAIYGNNTGSSTLEITSLYLVNSTGAGVLACMGIGLPSSSSPACTTASYNNVRFPIYVNPGRGIPIIDTGVTAALGNAYVIKVVAGDGNIFSATYPPSEVSLAAQALTSGAIGDLYLSFGSYTYYTVACNNRNLNGCSNYNIISSSCPYTGPDSGYCLDTNSGNTGSAFSMSVSTYRNDYIGFSVTLTDLNLAQKDIILDQFSLIYQSLFGYYWYGAQGEVPWYVVSVGTASNGMIPVFNQYTPIVLRYNVPTTVYFVTANCVTDSYGGGQNHVNCFNANGNGYFGNLESICQAGYGGNCNDLPGTISTVFIISSGWELAHGSYNVANLAYSGTNYGQNTPFVSTLYY